MANSLWSDFKDGKVYLRVEREDWDAFIERCERDGLRSRSGRRASEFNPLRGDSHIFISHNLWGDGSGLGWDRPDDPYHKTCGLPIHEFKSVLGDSAKEGDSGMAHTFKVGDIVRGISDNYSITNKGMTRGKVVRVGSRDIRVKLLEHTDAFVNRRCKGGPFDVRPECFKLVEPASLISRVLYNPPATVVFWSDGSKTAAKCAANEQYDREKGLAIACAKKLLGEGYADEFKEFREPVNRVLSWDEVKALPEGCKVFCEKAPWGYVDSDVRTKRGKRLYSAQDTYWTIDIGSLKLMRVWLLPRKPTAAELAANPWKLEGN